MKIKAILFSLLLICFSNSNGYEFESVGSDLSQGFQPSEIAKHAYKDDHKAKDIVSEMIDNGVDVVRAVQTVVKTWSSCDDTYSVVQAGVSAFPERSGEIVASIASMKNCNCNSESFWAKSRLMKRLEPSIQKSFVKVSSLCGCSAAGIAAAVEVLPNKAEEMIQSVLVSKNRASNTMDTFGQIGKMPEQYQWDDEDDLKTKNTTLVRKDDQCRADKNGANNFNANNQWYELGDKSYSSPTQQNNNELGSHEMRCKDEERDEEDYFEEEEVNSFKKVVISQYVQDGENQSLEIFNNSDEPLDLQMENYQIEIYFHGYDFPGSIVQLNGVVPPQSTFVVSSSNASGATKEKSDQTVNGLTFKGADAISLKSGFPANGCACSASTVSSALTSLSSDGDEEQSSNNQNNEEEREQLLEQLKQHYNPAGPKTLPVDSIGRLEIKDEEENKEERTNKTEVLPLPEKIGFRRLTNTCKGDKIEVDEFEAGKGWTPYEPSQLDNLGSFSAEDCKETRNDLIISEYIEDSENEDDMNNNVVEFYNGTPRAIDFDEQEYYLEIFGEDHNSPTQRIKLEGKVEANSTFLVSHENAEEAVKDKANQTTAELDLKNTYAVVLQKAVSPAFKSCHASVGDLVQTLDSKRQIIIQTEPTRDPGSGPDSDDDPNDGDDGGQIASPN